jgi:hypothetical protein
VIYLKFDSDESNWVSFDDICSYGVLPRRPHWWAIQIGKEVIQVKDDEGNYWSPNTGDWVVLDNFGRTITLTDEEFRDEFYIV